MNTSACGGRAGVSISFSIVLSLSLLFASLWFPTAGEPAEAPSPRFNVLMIVVDDLRPVLGCYGDPLARTPCLDRLASRGVVFRRAYCQASVCLPSRTSVLTGLRPDTTGVLTNRDPNFRLLRPDWPTLPQHFKNHGAWSASLGKVFHRKDRASWSEPEWIPLGNPWYPIYGKPETLALQRRRGAGPEKPSDWWGFAPGRNRRWAKALSWEDPDVSDDVLFDGQLALEAAARLRRLQRRGAPFFLAAGFFRPHLPFVAPKAYWQAHSMSSLRLPANRTRPAGAPPFAHDDGAEPRSYLDVPPPGQPIPEKKQQELLRGYYASVRYVDAQIGRVVAELERLGLSEQTVVVVWSDHGYHLGEHGAWGKHTNFEEATRSTLIVSAPGCARGRAADGLVELVDIYPTLCELCGLPEPEGLEGRSFARLLRRPDGEGKTAALSQAGPRGVAGRSVRTERYRYTEWGGDGEKRAVELYDHRTDPGENVNLAERPELEGVRRRLAQLLRSGATGARDE